MKRWSGDLAWKVEFNPHALKELSRLARPVQHRILRFLHERIETEQDPRRLDGLLHGTKGNLWKYRIGDYRLICDIRDDMLIVLVLTRRPQEENLSKTADEAVQCPQAQNSECRMLILGTCAEF